MKVSKNELAKLCAMLESFKNEHGTIAMSLDSTQNSWGCSGFCANTCNTNCSARLEEGGPPPCWKRWKGNG